MSGGTPLPGKESGTVTVDGVVLPVRAGQTVAGVLLGLGRTSWRSTRRYGRPRGVFCGIGVCFDCLVVVNGVPDVRACLRTVVGGDVIEVQDGARLPYQVTETPVDGADSGAVEGERR